MESQNVHTQDLFFTVRDKKMAIYVDVLPAQFRLWCSREIGYA
jgi:hypothetical protein